MTHPIKCYIDRFPIIDMSRFEWAITEGTQPYSTSFVMLKGIAESLANVQRNRLAGDAINPYLTLTMTDHLGTNLKFNNIYVLPPEPYSDPRFLTVTIVDNRYFWNRMNFNHAFNVKTKVGDRILRREGGLVYDLKGIKEDGGIPFDTFEGFSYKTVSMYPPNLELVPSGSSSTPPRPWAVSDIILFILETYKNAGTQPRFDISKNDPALKSFDKVVVEDLWIDSDVASALNQVLSYARGLGLFVDNLGNVRFFNRTYGENVLLDNAGMAHEPNEYFYYTRGDLASPRYIDVLFTREMEVRFDFEETTPLTDSETTSETDPINTEQRALFNVMPCPDASITLPNGSKVINGQYVRFQDIIPAYKASIPYALKLDGTPVSTDMTMSFEDIQRCWCTQGWLTQFAGFKDVTPRYDWINRINAIKQNYRQTYQISKKWIDKMTRLKADRVSIVDNATKTYAPSPVYQPYCIQYSARGIIAPAAVGEPEKFHYMRNVDEFTGEIASSKVCELAQITLTEPEDKGIIKISFYNDPLGHYEKIYPSKCIEEAFGTHKMGDKVFPKFKDEPVLKPPGEAQFFPSLAPTHRMAIILTATPSPNITGDLYRFRVLPTMISEDIYPGLRAKILNSIAPPLDVRAPFQNITARYPWFDDEVYRKSTEACFGIGTESVARDRGAAAGGGVFDRAIDEKMLNRQQVEQIAIRIAAATWVNYQDRVKGGKETFLHQAYPQGTISRIVFRVDSNGKSGTVLKADANVTGPDFTNLLPAPLRAFYFGQVGSKG